MFQENWSEFFNKRPSKYQRHCGRSRLCRPGPDKSTSGVVLFYYGLAISLFAFTPCCLGLQNTALTTGVPSKKDMHAELKVRTSCRWGCRIPDWLERSSMLGLSWKKIYRLQILMREKQGNLKDIKNMHGLG